MEGLYLAFLLIAVIGFVLPRRRSKNISEKRAQVVLSNALNTNKRLSIAACGSIMRYGEQRIFKLLSEALPEHYVFPQVSFNALITHAPHIYGSYINSVRQKFHHKFVDFVICDRATMKIFAVVEYDGSGHNNKNDAYRDKMLQSVGYRVERFSEADTLDSIRTRFNPVIVDPPQITEAKT